MTIQNFLHINVQIKKQNKDQNFRFIATNKKKDQEISVVMLLMYTKLTVEQN